MFQVILLLLAIGFPLALFFARAYELTPEVIKLEKDVDRSESITHITGRKFDFIIIGVLVVAVGFLLVDKTYLSDGNTASDEIIATERKSIAVLPFVNMSPDPDQEYFSDGMSEEILNLLAKIPELKVIGRTSSFAFKGKNEDLRLIGEALGVTTVLEGSVRKSGDRVRITAQLIDVSDGAHIWSETYNRTLNDIFAVQDDVAAAIIDALQIHVGANPTRGRPTENTAAYALHLKARASINVVQYGDAQELLGKAIELDPNYAEAHELLAFSIWYQGSVEITAADAQKLVGEAAARALAIDPDLVFARALYQSGNIEDWSWLKDIEAFERAARDLPSNPGPLDALVFALTINGYLQEASGIAERAVEIDPLSAQTIGRWFAALHAAGRTSERATAQKIAEQLDVEPQGWGLFFFGAGELAEGRDDIAISYFETWLQVRHVDTAWVRELVTDARDPVTGQAYLDRRIPEIVASMPKEFAYSIQRELKTWYLHFGFLDRLFELILDLDLTNSTWTDADYIVYTGTIYRRAGFTAHPKYLEVAESMGIIDVWEQRGPPDFCAKTGGQWVCE